jgi:Rhs element Vgr protein
MSNDRIIPTTKPADLVTYTLQVNGSEVPRTILVQSISVQQEINRIPVARLAIIDGDGTVSDFAVSDQDLFVPGYEIEIFAGYHSDETSIFKGIITKLGIRVRGDNTLLMVECRDKFVKLTAGKKNKYYFDKTDSEVIGDIVNAYGLDNTIGDTSVQHKELVQFDATDWDFMLSRLEANGNICIIGGGQITTQKPAMDGDPVLDLLFGATIMEFDSEMDVRDQYRGVSAFSWDYSSQQIVNADAAEPGLEEAGNITATDLGDVIGLSSYELRHTGQVPQEELQAWADAQLLKNRLSKVKGRVRFQGFADVKPATVINLGGLGDRVNGKVFVAGIRHEIADGNWISDAQFGLSPQWFSSEHTITTPKAAGMLPAVNGLQIGVVTQLKEDPDGEDRIRVRLPIIDDQDQGALSRVASPDAGNNRGVFFRPEIGDEVIVGFLNDDPRDPVVLGMLNSSAKPAPLTAADENNEKGYVSRSAMKLIFNDDKKSILLSTPGGRSIFIDDDTKVIKLEDGNGNKIVLNDVGISIESAKAISFKAKTDITTEGNNISSKAQMSLKAEGTAGIELKSSATAVLKGSLVQIN